MEAVDDEDCVKFDGIDSTPSLGSEVMNRKIKKPAISKQ